MPAQTTPLTRLILTTEGVLVVAFNAVIALASIFGSLPGVQAVKYAAIVNAVTVFSRQALKAIASLTPVLGTPTPPVELDALEQFVKEIQSTPEIPETIIAKVAAETQAQETIVAAPPVA
jgi:hypothetical protein